MNHLARFAVLGAALALAGCGGETSSDAPVEEATEAAVPAEDLPAIEVQEGDGLPETLPTDLVWETNDEDPVFASPEAQPGGTFRTYMLSFPLTLRRVGPDSNGFIAPYLRYNQLSLVTYHPQTRRPFRRWRRTGPSAPTDAASTTG